MSDTRLARAMAATVRAGLSGGRKYLRVPEIESPMPIAELLADLGTTSGDGPIHVALFTPGPTGNDASGVVVTQNTATAIEWRNDPNISGPLIVIGDLDRDRASGLADMRTVTGREGRHMARQ